MTFLVRGVKPLICVVGLQFGQEPCERPQVNCAQSCCEHGLSFLFKDVIEAFGVLIGSTDTYEKVFLYDTNHQIGVLCNYIVLI